MDIRKICEKCGAGLMANSPAFLCSYECTFCEKCTSELKNKCPNCQGKLESRREKIIENISVRKAVTEDINGLNKLFNGYLIFYRKKIDLEKSRHFLLERLKTDDSEILVAEYSKSVLVGFVQLYPIFSSLQMKRSWLLNDLYVQHDFRKLSVSRKLINSAKELCNKTNASGLFLETEKNNVAANGLYVKEGFELDKTHHFYTWNNEGE